MPQERHLESKVGFFVLSALIALAIFIFSVTGTVMFEEGKVIKVVFGFANGLKVGAPVRVAGVDEGIVKDIRLFFDREDSGTKVEVDIFVNKDTKIPADSEVLINQLGLMGEKYIEIVPGVNTRYFLEEGQTINGLDPVAQEAVSRRVMEVTGKVEEAVKGVNKIVNKEKNQDSIELILENMSVLTNDLSAVVGGVREGHGTIGRLFKDERLYDNLQEITFGLKEGEGTVGRLLTDDSLYNNLESLSADLKENPWKILHKPKTKKRR